MLEIVGTSKVDKKSINEFFQKHWGSQEMVISSGTFKCEELDGFVAVNKRSEIVGLLTYFIHKNVCEIISLDSILENKGIGTELLKKIEKEAYSQEVLHIKVTTTNDNIRALSFYQKRGYCLTELLLNEVEKARKVKPEIPQVANNGIPIRDEIVLSKKLQGSINV
ncbi:GNAT family N-acetyltransferase [Fictibacillus nanhaiensis]|uniref:GNAT family N-acetyltransferase n=1 Tax=Fictibacillus nanhaiensis TaxID=742169 RepID=UPI002E1F99C6|nr:GNAT family N-acetyltransferase [Fictibacillus nanhaiensis]